MSYYIYRQIAGGWAEISGRLSLSPWLVLGLVLLAAPPLLCPGVWWFILRALGARSGLREAYWAWSAANLGKYMPGKVWNIAGRFYFSREHRAMVAESIGLEVISNLWAAFLAGATGGLFGLKLGGVIWAMALGALLGLAGLVRPRLIQRAIRLPARLLKKDFPVPGDFPRSAYLIATGAFYLIWLAVGLGLWFVVKGMGFSAHPLALAGAYAISWMVGYLFLLVPGGFGVREGTFSWLLPQAGFFAVVAIVARLAITIWEIIVFGLALALRPRKRAP